MTDSDREPSHAPVLLDETLSFLSPKAGGVYCDATVGLGGHARAVLDACAPDGRLIGIDRDLNAIDRARGALAELGQRCVFVHARFGSLRTILQTAAPEGVDGCLVDLGVSSMQLDSPLRGFSFRHEGPLDMRMDQSQGETAQELLARLGEEELTRILRDLGEERYAAKIARAIVLACQRGELATTSALSALVARTVPTRERHKNPATRTFQAVRIALNDELGEIERFLADAPACLRPGGRLVVISFHSLEDRMVKRRFRALAAGQDEGAPPARILTKHVVVASEEERARNPRSRSAKLRALERLAS
jgi:16S rRNA (cytosine1402-N4)-methyltransferase